MIYLLDKFRSWDASKFFFSKFSATLNFWESFRELKTSLYRVKTTFGADLKEGFSCFLGNTVHTTNSTEVVFLFKMGSSLLISKLSLISKENLEEAFARTKNSSKEESLSQISRWSRAALSFEGLHFLKVKGDKTNMLPSS